MQADLEEISMEYERTHAAAIITEKRGKNFDKVKKCIISVMRENYVFNILYHTYFIENQNFNSFLTTKN